VISPTATTRFLYDGDRLAIEYDGAGTVLRAYDHGTSPDEHLIWYEAVPGGTSRRYLHADHQGSIIAVADQNGNPIAINGYDSWGIPNAGNQGRFGYTGQAWLPELGMWYYKARIYSPTLGRFLQTDPVGYKDQVNLYAYVGNDPVDGRDPTGKVMVARAGQEIDVARRINNLTRARYAFTGKNGALRQVQAAAPRLGSRLASSSYYDNRIAAAIASSKTITISIADKVSDPVNWEISIYDPRIGGGATYADDNGNRSVAIARGGVIGTTDTNGKPLVQSSDLLLMHELVVHAIPGITGADVGRGLDNENKVRQELGLPLRAPDPVTHPYGGPP
jgi:RHS repeat-associated protein